MMNMIKDKWTGNYWEESSLFTLGPEKTQMIYETNPVSPEWLMDFEEAYTRGEFFWALGSPETQHEIWEYRHGSFSHSHKGPKIQEICNKSNSLRFVVFDEYPGKPDLQLIRICEDFQTPYGRHHWYKIHEVGRWVLDPKRKSWYSIEFPDSRNNSSETYYPFADSQSGFLKFCHKLGGYQGSVSLGRLYEELYWVKKLAPGVTIPRDLLKVLLEKSKLPKKDTWGYEYSRYCKLGPGDLDIFLEGSVIVKFLQACPFLKFYEESGSTGFYPTYLMGKPEVYRKTCQALGLGWKPKDINEIKDTLNKWNIEYGKRQMCTC